VFTKLGRPLPPPVRGFMLVDTGATKTNIAEEAALRLGLRPVGQSRGFGASGQHVRNDYEVHLSIRIIDQHGNKTVIESEQLVSGVPDLMKHSEALGLRNNDRPVAFIGLLGRDFLRHTTFMYSGTRGFFEIRVDLSTMGKPEVLPVSVVQAPAAGQTISGDAPVPAPSGSSLTEPSKPMGLKK
jgi:hypothetical protein